MTLTDEENNNTPSIKYKAEEALWRILQEVKDPEVPVLSIIDLGIVRNVEVISSVAQPHTAPLKKSEEENAVAPKEEVAVQITITPTYSGCPAMDVINMDIRLKLIENGYKNVNIKQQLSPAWTTSWITLEGKEKLKAFGIAPPNATPQLCTTEMFMEEAVECPRCHSYHTQLISQFSSTACKAMYRCLNCEEAFDYFKCH